MRATTGFSIIIEGSQDAEVIEMALLDALAEALPETTMVNVSCDGVKTYSEQGGKVARKRIFGVDVKQAGDGANTTKLEEVA